MATKGERLFMKGQYEEALEAFLKADARDTQDDSRIGATVGAAQVMMCQGRFKDAEERLKAEMPKAIWTMACHPVNIGISCWFRSRYQDAVTHFRKALKSQYQSDDGFGSYFVLYYAAARRPAGIEIAEVQALITRRLNRWPPPVPSASLYTAQFVNGMIDEDEYLSHSAVLGGRYAKYWERYYRTKAAFYIGLARLRQGDKKAFASAMKRVSTEPLEQIFTEQLIARLETQRLARKRS